MTPKDAHTLTRYNAWANGLFFDAVAALPQGEAVKPRTSVFKSIAHTLNHNTVIQLIWQAHLEGREHGFTARNTPDHPPLAEMRRRQEEVDRWYVDYYDALDAARLEEPVDFVLVGGNAGRMTRGEILLHLYNHSTYHRGYVGDMFFQVPARPPTTDLPVYLRSLSRA